MFDVTTTHWIVLLAVFLGCFARTAMPYLRKAKDAAEKDPKAPFDFHWSYAVTFLFALVESLIASVIALPLVTVDLGMGSVLIFCGAFAWAYMSTDMANRISS